jgi:hypothetical protein
VERAVHGGPQAARAGIRGGVGCQRGSVGHEVARAAPVALVVHQPVRVLLRPWWYGSVLMVEQHGRGGAQDAAVVMRREAPRRGRGGPPVVCTGSGRSAEGRTARLLQFSDALRGTWRLAPEL